VRTRVSLCIILWRRVRCHGLSLSLSLCRSSSVYCFNEWYRNILGNE
jgi:hypothetical protein